MLDVPHTAHTVDGIFDRLDAEWTALRAGSAAQAAMTDWLVTGHLADDVAPCPIQ
ncbi:hypothetical protein ACFWOJ_39255 [Streptomyces sp. NPDC058439]|uniref:hypothetical protein n=1 Tax=Streptomyces sp. NPDC058439 TaxID=3346500 RepID=UPI003663153F